MSLASYIGCNVELPLSGEESDSLIIIGDCFADEFSKQEVKENHFSTPFVYEVSSDWGIEITEYMDKEMYAESKEKLIVLCEIMGSYLEKGDYFELYSCWAGEGAEKREGEITLPINNFGIEKIELPERTLVRFEK